MSIISLSVESSVRLYRDDVPSVVSPYTGRIWMDRNLGALRVAQSTTDADAQGWLYQWGRLTDGHQLRNSSTTSVLSATSNPGNNFFITATVNPFDWRSPVQDGSAWQGVNGLNNPCPAGFRIPSLSEFNDEIYSLPTQTIQSVFDSFLKLIAGGTRLQGGAIATATWLYYWGAGTNTGPGYRVAEALRIDTGGPWSGSDKLVEGHSCRCIKN